ncbi:MAG: acyl-CoA thioesterase II [Pseudomonadota bacterium]
MTQETESTEDQASPGAQASTQASAYALGGEERAAQLLARLQLEPIERDLFRGENETPRNARLFGGQVLSQALRAAYATVTDPALAAHSLHGYFLRAGRHDRPVLYEVDRIRDGRSFATRRVVGIQKGEAIFSLSVSLHKPELGFDHAVAMPNVPPPDALENDDEVARELPEGLPGLSPWARLPWPFIVRSVFRPGSEAFAEPRRFAPAWVRFRGELSDERALHDALLAYASDIGLVSTAALPHLGTTDRSALQMASLDHSLWLHRPFRVDEWLLFNRHTTSAVGARGLNHTEIFDQSGLLVASATQEGLLRPLA